MKVCRILCHLIWGIWRLHRLKYFEAMKAGKLAIWPWLSCRYTENTLMEEPWFSKNLWPSQKMWTLILKSASSELISSHCTLTFDNGKEFDHISWHKFAARLRFSGKGFIGVIWFSLFLTLSLFFFNHFRIIYQMLLTSTVILCQCC